MLEGSLGLEGDQATGVEIVRRAADEPLRWIAENAGLEGYVVVAKVRALEPGHGLNAATGEYVDLIAAGVIDPVKVTRSALEHAASIAAMLLTTETLVVEKRDDEADHAAGAGTATRTAPVATATERSATQHGPGTRQGSGAARACRRRSAGWGR